MKKTLFGHLLWYTFVYFYSFQFAVHITADVHNPKFVSPMQQQYDRMFEVKLFLGVTWQTKIYAMSGFNRQYFKIIGIQARRILHQIKYR